VKGLGLYIPFQWESRGTHKTHGNARELHTFTADINVPAKGQIPLRYPAG